MTRDKGRILLIGLYAAIVAVAVFAGYRMMALDKATANLYATPYGQFQGNPEGGRIIVEFLDYRCGYCRDVHPVMMEVLARNPDVKIIYRHFPVFGRPSVIDAEIALAAGMQGKFTEAHHRLMAQAEPLSEREIDDLARDLGLNVEKFRIDMKDRDMGFFLLETLDMAEALGIKSTPTFMIGDILYTLNDGMPTPEKFEALLDQAYGRPQS